jgi:hypothetical protein
MMKSPATAVETAILDVISALVAELAKKDVIDVGRLMDDLETIAAAHCARGDHRVAYAIRRVGEYVRGTVPECSRNDAGVRPPAA